MNSEPEGLDVERLLYQWPMSEPWTLQPTGAGVNNVNMFVTTPSARYVLRIYQQSTTEAVEYEHSVLTALGTADLPFAIPVPLATHTATTYVHLAESNHLACLVPRLSGEAPQGKNLRQARTAGEALGLLVEALARVSTPCGSPKYAPYADLQAYLPPGHTTVSALAAAPTLDDAAKRELTVLFARVEAAIPALWPTLPRQLVHRDYWPTNVLMDGDQVAAILDFEFAGEDIRALDFAIGLTWWAMFQDNLESWEMLEAFGTGYAGVTTLTPAEVRALPDLALLRLATGLTHYMGRCLSGLEPWDRVVPYLAQRALFLADWLYRHEEALVEQAARWWNRPA